MTPSPIQPNSVINKSHHVNRPVNPGKNCICICRHTLTLCKLISLLGKGNLHLFIFNEILFSWGCKQNFNVVRLDSAVSRPGIISLHIRSMWETICDAWACWSGWKFGPNSTEYPYSEIQNTPLPPRKLKFRQILALCDFSVSEYPPPPPENWNLGRSWHFVTFQFQNPPLPENWNLGRSWHFVTFQFQNPPLPENWNLGRSSQWETMCGKLPHVETLSNPDNYSLYLVKVQLQVFGSGIENVVRCYM